MKKKIKKIVRKSRQVRRPRKSSKSLKINKLSRVNSPQIARIQAQSKSHQVSDIKNGVPHHYGDNKIVLMVRDPWWLYAYWEVTPERESEVAAAIQGQRLVREKTVLRIYDTTGTVPEKANLFFDIELNFFAECWYIDVGKPDREWVVDLGIRTTNGKFFTLVRSNGVRTPRFGPSELLDEEWMLPEEISRKIFGLSGGERGSSSLDFRKLWGLWGRSSDLTRKVSVT